MKKVNADVVCFATLMLIHTNKKTTTLEVKNLLRHLNYNASQDEVSAYMNELYERNVDENGVRNYERNHMGSHFEYTFSNFLLNTDDLMFAEDFVEPSVFTMTDDEDEEEDDSNESILGSIIQNTLTSKRSVTPQGIFEDNISIETEIDMDWIVNSTLANTEFVVYDSTYTRDEVRNHFARTFRVKKDDVRARREKNF